MKKLLLASVFVFCLPITVHAAPTTISVDYENVQTLIKNQYAAQEVCRSGRETTEVMIMCDYANAAERKLEQLGYCLPYDDKPVSQWEWHKCPKNENLMNNSK